LHHLKIGNQQKTLHPVCKLIILISRDNISFQSWQNVFRSSGIDTIDKVSIWDQLLNSQLLTLLGNWLTDCSKPSWQYMYKLIWHLETVFDKINNNSPMLIPNIQYYFIYSNLYLYLSCDGLFTCSTLTPEYWRSKIALQLNEIKLNLSPHRYALRTYFSFNYSHKNEY